MHTCPTCGATFVEASIASTHINTEHRVWPPLDDTLHGPECCADCKAGIPTHRANTACGCD